MREVREFTNKIIKKFNTELVKKIFMEKRRNGDPETNKRMEQQEEIIKAVFEDKINLKDLPTELIREVVGNLNLYGEYLVRELWETIKKKEKEKRDDYEYKLRSQTPKEISEVLEELKKVIDKQIMIMMLDPDSFKVNKEKLDPFTKWKEIVEIHWRGWENEKWQKEELNQVMSCGHHLPGSVEPHVVTIRRSLGMISVEIKRYLREGDHIRGIDPEKRKKAREELLRMIAIPQEKE